MALLIRHWGKSLVLLLTVFSLYTLWSENRGRDRTVAFLVDAGEAARICSAEGYPLGDFLERARTIGAVGAVIRPEPLGDFLRSGEILRFSADEIAKLRQTGVASAAAPLKPGSLWIKSRVMVDRLTRAARAHRLPVRWKSYGEMRVAELPPDASIEGVSMGYDPALARKAAAKGLLPAYRIGTAPELLLAVGSARPSIFLIAPGYRHPPSRPFSELRDAMHQGDVWLAFSDAGKGLSRSERAAFLSGLDRSLDRILTAGAVRAGDGLESVLRMAVGRGNRAVTAGLDSGADVEENLAALRRLVRGVRSRGYVPGLSAGWTDVRSAQGGEWLLRFGLGFLLAVAGPILALRLAVRSVRRMKAAGNLPVAAPFREALTGMLMAVVCAAAAGLAAHALFSLADWRLEATSLRWGSLAAVTTLAVSAAGMYLPEADVLSRLSKKQLRAGPLIKMVILAAAVLLVLFPPPWLLAWGPAGWAQRFARRSESWWWAADRWREWSVGLPCLLTGLTVFFQKLEAQEQGAEAEREDPRAWLLLGLFAPIGLIDVLARAQVPFEGALLHSALSMLPGALLGVVLYGARCRLGVTLDWIQSKIRLRV